jgi:uncharacterized membrane protein
VVLSRTSCGLERAAQLAIIVGIFGVLACRSSEEGVNTRSEPLVPGREESARISERPRPASAAPSESPGITPVVPPPKAADETESASANGGGTSYRVHGVAADDVLNIRVDPDAEAASSGTIPSDAKHVEGLGAPKKVGATTWQRIRYGGAVGWVNERFLKANAGGVRSRPPAPAKIEALTPLVCFGNEPYWSLRFGADGMATCGSACEAPAELRVTKVLADRSGTPDGFDLVDGKGNRWMRAVISKTGKCSDGMSDDPYPYELTGIVKSGNFTGCCRIKTKDEL